MKPIDAEKLLSHLNDWWLSETPRDGDIPQVKERQKIICDTIEAAMQAVEEQPEIDVGGGKP